MEQKDIQITKAESLGQREGKIVWTITKPVATHDGKIFFYDETLECFFDITIHQTKGEGAYYYEDVEKPDADHIEIMTMLQFLKPQNRSWSKQELLNQLKLFRHTFQIKKQVAVSPFLGRMSEFTRKKVITLDKGADYKINHEYISKILSSGKY